MSDTRAMVGFLLVEVKGALIKAELNAAYCAVYVRETRRKQAVLRYVVAIAACAPFISKLGSVSSDAAGWVTAIVPLIAIALPIWNADKSIEQAAEIFGKYSSVLPGVRELWRELSLHYEYDRNIDHYDVAEAKDRLSQLDARLTDCARAITNVPDLPRLKAWAARSVPSYEIVDRGKNPADKFPDSILSNQGFVKRMDFF